jgi:GNAT superfamily N-acetyltransferase
VSAAVPLTPAVRPARASDVDELIRLDSLARAHLGPHRGGELYLLRDGRPVPPGPSFRDDLEDPRRLVLLGSIADSAVGYAIVALQQLRDGYLLADVSEIFVEADARDVGVGEALMEAVTTWAAAQGCDGIDARALPGDRHTKNFFETFGLVARAITVHKDLRTS